MSCLPLRRFDLAAAQAASAVIATRVAAEITTIKALIQQRLAVYHQLKFIYSQKVGSLRAAGVRTRVAADPPNARMNMAMTLEVGRVLMLPGFISAELETIEEYDKKWKDLQWDEEERVERERRKWRREERRGKKWEKRWKTLKGMCKVGGGEKR